MDGEEQMGGASTGCDGEKDSQRRPYHDIKCSGRIGQCQYQKWQHPIIKEESESEL